MNSILKTVISEYRKSIIQSEEEVRSKLIVPLINALGYPSEFRAEEFPVFGYAGAEELHSKSADYILFDDKEFALHRTRTQKNLEWVENHSLLIVEAKKPGKMKDDLGQAKFYNRWTKAVGYIMTDGKRLRGFYSNPLKADFEIIDCMVDDLPDNDNFDKFAFTNLSEIKALPIASVLGINCTDDCVIEYETDIELPAGTRGWMQKALGRNAEGLSDAELISKFSNMTDFYIQNDFRYNIPKYIIDIPRIYSDAKLYIDNSPASAVNGQILEFYWENIDRYDFESDYIDIKYVVVDKDYCGLLVNVHVCDESVEERLKHLNTVRKIFHAKAIYIITEPIDTIKIDIEAASKNWENDNDQFIDVCIDCMTKLKAIEEYYGIEFKLEYVEEKDMDYYGNAIEYLYSGIMFKQNTIITGIKEDSFDECTNIDQTIFIEEIPKERREKITIYNITFETYKSYLVPCEIEKIDETVTLPVCCQCKVVE